MRNAARALLIAFLVLAACASAPAQEQRPVVALLYGINDEVAFADVTREQWEAWQDSFVEINRLDKEFRDKADELGKRAVALACAGGERRMQAQPFDFGKEMEAAKSRLRAGVLRQTEVMRALAAKIALEERRKATLQRIERVERLYAPDPAAAGAVTPRG